MLSKSPDTKIEIFSVVDSLVKECCAVIKVKKKEKKVWF